MNQRGPITLVRLKRGHCERDIAIQAGKHACRSCGPRVKVHHEAIIQDRRDSEVKSRIRIVSVTCVGAAGDPLTPGNDRHPVACRDG